MYEKIIEILSKELSLEVCNVFCIKSVNQLSFDDIGGALIGIINRMNRAFARYLSLSLILTGSCVHPFVVTK